MDFVTDISKLKSIVRRFDEVISTKTSKFQMAEFVTQIETEYALKKDVAERDLARKGEVAKITQTTETVRELVEFQYKAIQKEMNSAVTRIVKT